MTKQNSKQRMSNMYICNMFLTSPENMEWSLMKYFPKIFPPWILITCQFYQLMLIYCESINVWSHLFIYLLFKWNIAREDMLLQLLHTLHPACVRVFINGVVVHNSMASGSWKITVGSGSFRRVKTFSLVFNMV